MNLTQAQAYYLLVKLANGATIGGQTPIGNTPAEVINGIWDVKKSFPAALVEITLSETPFGKDGRPQ